MKTEDKANVVKMRIKSAKENLTDAELALKANRYKNTANRAYYCIFHAMRALLISEGYDSKKHSGIISEFRKRYIKTGAISKEYSYIIKEAFDARIGSDYDDMFEVDKEDALKLINDAKSFLAEVEKQMKEQ
jgi:uncharacterized protein (UPF0332 family)